MNEKDVATICTDLRAWSERISAANPGVMNRGEHLGERAAHLIEELSETLKLYRQLAPLEVDDSADVRAVQGKDNTPAGVETHDRHAR